MAENPELSKMRGTKTGVLKLRSFLMEELNEPDELLDKLTSRADMSATTLCVDVRAGEVVMCLTSKTTFSLKIPVTASSPTKIYKRMPG
ncbi:hypothetical protein [Serratia marcescens]|uniref:hypothetical protein n=1 Tax=Serratia marcescens TaxID=615 RepID=UPI003A8AD06C